MSIDNLQVCSKGEVDATVKLRDELSSNLDAIKYRTKLEEAIRRVSIAAEDMAHAKKAHDRAVMKLMRLAGAQFLIEDDE